MSEEEDEEEEGRMAVGRREGRMALQAGEAGPRSGSWSAPCQPDTSDYHRDQKARPGPINISALCIGSPSPIDGASPWSLIQSKGANLSLATGADTWETSGMGQWWGQRGDSAGGRISDTKVTLPGYQRKWMETRKTNTFSYQTGTDRMLPFPRESPFIEISDLDFEAGSNSDEY